MKRILLLAVFVLGSTVCAFAQGYMFVDSEKLFKSIPSYNTVIKELDDMAQAAQKDIDNATENLDKMYNNYQSQKAYLSETNRNARENEIINREKEINEYQQKMFGQDGELMTRRVEKIKPIQERVFGAITSYAKANGYTMVTDIVNNQTLLYYSPELDKTQELINILKQ